MKKLLIVYLAIASLAFAQSDKECRDYISNWEGVSHFPYYCSRGSKTIGIGHKMSYLESATTVYVTDKQIDELFAEDLANAREIARSVFPSFWRQPPEIKIMLIDLSFNMGYMGMLNFKEFQKAIDSNNYIQAAKELQNSLYYYQTGRRARHHVSVLSSYFRIILR